MNSRKNIFNLKILEKFKGALAFSAVGDALGWQTEFIRYPRELKKRFGKKYIDDYHSWEKIVGGKFWGYKEIIKEGEYSDDTQLTLSVYRCIDESGNFNPNKFAYFELPLWLQYERGGGKTVKTSAKQLITKEWMNNFYTTKELSYRNAGSNGAAMRVLPIALVNINNNKRLYRDTFINSIITHGHPRAILGAIIYASAINFLLKENKISKKTFLEYLYEVINNFSKSFKGDDLIQKWVREWDKEPLDGMTFKEVFKKTRAEAIEYLRKLEGKIGDKEYYKLTGALSEDYKSSGISTVSVAIYLFLKYIDNPKKAILKAVNMLGSDTDTISAFVGGLFGAYYGLSAVPEGFLSKLQDKEYILRVATDLYNVAIGKPIEKKEFSSKPFYREAYEKIIAWENQLSEMFRNGLKEGDKIFHPALGQGVIKGNRVQPLKRKDYQVKIIEVEFECGQSCVFHFRVSKNGKLSENLAKDMKKMLSKLKF